ncbi:hypothetical protein ACZ87_01852 [Candidatus Erwinia dacicola]|uniref:Uncharacterized protein n=1 Tax=Candidatus Erwinia dacicola TaxID=252393 RepID=A0A328TQZ2_9GAMM|nr:hypothetical protein ACZ87_01852 [Candidatus Erwinia dacicola]
MNSISNFEENKQNCCLVVNQFYQWIMRTVLKNYFWIVPDVRDVVDKCRYHKIGYWERESKLLNIYNSNFKKLSEIDRVKLFTIIVKKSLNFFNELISGICYFKGATINYNSKLISECNSRK